MGLEAWTGLKGNKMVKVLGVVPLSAVKGFRGFEKRCLDLLLVTDAGILVLRDLCKLKGLEDFLPISLKELCGLFTGLPETSKGFREYTYSVIGLNIDLDGLAETLGTRFSKGCLLIPSGTITSLGLRRRTIHMVVTKTSLIEVEVKTEEKSHRFLVLPASYKDLSEEAAYNEVLDMLRRAKTPVTPL